MEKLLRSNSNRFKAKAALLTIVGSVVEVGAVEGGEMVGSLVGCLVGFLGSEDWAVRKAAAEALLKLAVVEGFGGGVKVVRETMNQLVEAWKGIANLEDAGASSPPEPQSSSKGIRFVRFICLLVLSV
ncbi:hypothetical protein Vadar_020359 [Vaccinium darrowii]|uniref:Uncharacterized protein n=1 Tax=Vaccinium darrowii TaxID=229202 RepID=A0ACB7ZKA9_9ERIC|nr:hypothetical protein Vadar_020359 [Vaccinium darrowii]